MDQIFIPNEDISDNEEEERDDIDDPLEQMRIEEEDKDIDDEEENIATTTFNNEEIQWKSFFRKAGFIPVHRKIWKSNTNNSKSSPIEIYSLFLDNEVINLVVEETNRYADQYISSKQLKS